MGVDQSLGSDGSDDMVFVIPPRVELVNESSLIVYFSASDESALPHLIAASIATLRQTYPDLITDYVASFSSLLLSCESFVTSTALCADIGALRDTLQDFLSNSENIQAAQNHESRVHEIPVYYGEEVALDAELIAQQAQLSFAQCCELHASLTYQVRAVGFTAGFAYLGNIDARLQIPRKATPRLRVPLGSVAIADVQTAIYPSASPGGWNIIGRTPLRVMDLQQHIISRFQIGDSVQFQAISREAYLQQGGSLE